MTASFILPDQANSGFSDASRYDRHRPSYPDVAVEKLLANLGVKGQKNSRITDLGCGTGKFTELLAARPEQFQVLAVEPHEEMGATLIKKNLGSSIKVLNGSAGSIPAEEDWGDALIAAQASDVAEGQKYSLI
jgi:trans-aconitate methyltransferase